MRRTLSLATALFSSLALSLCLAACGGDVGATNGNGATFTVSRGTLRISLTESGTLEARHKTDVRPNIKSGAKVLTLVDEGTIVKEGDVLAELDKEAVETDIEKFEDKVLQFETELNNAKTDLDIQKGENESDIDQAKLRLEFARLALERYESGDYPQALREKRLRIDQAKSKLKQAEDKFKLMPELHERGFVTSVELEEKQLAVTEAEAEVKSAELDLELYEKYSHPMDLRQKNSDVTEAERDLSRVLARAEARLESKTAVLRQKQRQYDTATEKLTEARSELTNLTVYAPQPGIVIYSGRRDRHGNVEETIKIGDTAFPGRTLIELPDLTRMDVHLQVHQADIGKLKEGQPAFVTVPGQRSRTLKGRVTEIGSIAQSRSWRDPVKRFEVVVGIEEKLEGLRSGVTVEVEIQIGDLQDVLYVPLQTLSASGGNFYVFVDKDGESARRRVTLGRANDQYVVVTDGIAEGDRVLLVNPELAGEEVEEEGEGGGAGGGRPAGGQPSGARGAGERGSGAGAAGGKAGGGAARGNRSGGNR